MNPLKPAGLKRGDTISVVVPAGPVDLEQIDRALGRLADRGFHTKTYGNIDREDGYLAGDDLTRACELMDAFEDPETTAIWCARGGYGVVRIIDKLDFDVIRQHPKVFVGFSDISVLHVALAQRTGLCTFHAPNLQDGFGAVDDMLPTTESALWRAIMADQNSADDADYVIADAGLSALSPGTATGRLTGGNLAVICGMLGTPFEIETRDRVLFLEDIDERLYRVDRYFAQLTLAGKLQSASAILLGDFTFGERTPVETDEQITRVFDMYFRDMGVPVLRGVPSGHVRDNRALPMNTLVEADAERLCVVVRERTVC